jgi:hypothetical protein
MAVAQNIEAGETVIPSAVFHRKRGSIPPDYVKNEVYILLGYDPVCTGT